MIRVLLLLSMVAVVVVAMEVVLARRWPRFSNRVPPSKEAGFGVRAGIWTRKFLTTFRPRAGAAPWVPYDSAAIARNSSLTWIGHSTFLVRMDGITFLTDPMFSDWAGPLAFMGSRRLVPAGVPLEALPKVDFALLSHDHYDHTDFPSIKRLAERGVTFIVPLGLGELVRQAGGEAIELNWWESVTLNGVRIHCVPAQHTSGRALLDERRRLWAGWVVSGPTRKFFHAGDTGYAADFKTIGARLGPVDVATVSIGAYRPSALMQYVHTTPEEALRIGLDTRAQRIVAMHFGTFDLADEPLDEPPQRFRLEAERRGLSPDRAWVLQIGETREW